MGMNSRRDLRGHASAWVMALALGSAMTAAVQPARAGGLPGGGHYVSGKGTIGSSGSSMTVNQSSTTGIIDWNSFSVSKNKGVTFDNGDGATLNRVTGGNMSKIAGSLSATGSLYLINPEGVVVNGSGKVVTGGNFIASSGNVSDDDFRKGKSLHFTGANGKVINRGSITSTNGDAILIGNTVRNSGSISAAHGTAGMAAGTDVIVRPQSGDQNIFVKAGTGNATNTGVIAAANAEVRAAGGNVYALSGNNGGIIRATGVDNIGGHVWLTSKHGSVHVDGQVSADNAGGSGGTVVATGRKVVVGEKARISVAGTTGGTVLLGGDIHGGAVAADDFIKNKVKTAARTIVAKGAQIDADGSAGKGGHVVVWSEKHTDFAGSISAKGAGGKSGGFAEVSSHRVLGFSGQVNLTAPGGPTGELLLDPEDVIIENDPTSNGGFNNGSPNTFTPTGDDSILSVADLEAALSTANVTVTTGGSGSPGAQTGNITVLDPVTWSANTLTLDAYHSIDVDAAMSATGTARLALNTNYGGGSGGDLYFNGGNATFANTSESLAINGAPYMLIGSMAQLQAINASDTTLQGDYALAGSLDATSVSGWVPIGADTNGNVANSGNGFNGVFEGLGNTVAGLSVNAGTYSGLFAYSSGTLRDVGVTGADITGSGKLGALVAYNSGSVVNAYSTGTVSSSGDGDDTGGLVGANHNAITNSWSSAAVSTSGNGTEVGGLVGVTFFGSETDSYATGAVSAADNQSEVGGLVGGQYGGSVTGSHASGQVSGGGYLGGLVGDCYQCQADSDYATGAVVGGSSQDAGGLIGVSLIPTVTRSYATGAVSAQTGYAGGLVGEIDFGGAVDESYSLGLVTGAGTLGAFVGRQQGGTLGGTTADYYNNSGSNASLQAAASGAGLSSGGGLSADQMKNSANFTGWTFGGLGSGADWVIVDADGTVNNASGAAGGTTPMLLSEYSTTISSAHQLQLMELDPTATYVLAAGIDASGTAGGDVWGAQGFIPIAYTSTDGFTGRFEGTGNTISDLTIDEQSYRADVDGTVDDLGLFGKIGIGGLIRNVALSDASVTGLGAESGDEVVAVASNIGALAGENLGTISAVSVTGSSATGGFDSQVGGMVGSNEGSADIANSSVNSTTVHSTGETSTSQLSDGGALGGMVGYNDATMTGDTAAATITSAMGVVDGGLVGQNDLDGSISMSSANATVSSGGADGWIGGLVGQNFGTLAHDSSSGTATGGGNQYVGGLAGESTSDGSISYSSSIATVTGTAGDIIGGLIGENGGSVTSSFAKGTVSFASGNGNGEGGGLIGSNGGMVTSSYATGAVSSDGGDTLGGLVGFNDTNGSISGSHATGSMTETADNAIAGGLVGWNTGSITSSFAINGTVSVKDDSLAGGLVGDNGSYGGGIDATITNSYSTETVSAGKNGWAGGLAGDNEIDASITGSYATGGVTGTDGTSTGGLVGENDGDLETSFARGTVQGDSGVGGLVGYDIGTISGSHASGGVTGTSDVGGLVGDFAGTTLSNSFATGTVTGDEFVGGLAGAVVTGATLTNDWASGTVNGLSDVGGLVGDNFGTISGSHATGAVNTIAPDPNCDPTLGCTQVYGAGGLVGENESGAEIDTSYAIGNVTSAGNDGQFAVATGGLVGQNDGTVTTSQATGTVQGEASVGGFVGVNNATVELSHASGPASGWYQVGGFAGLNSSQITGSHATGNVTGVKSTFFGNSGDIGGFAGENDDMIGTSSATGTAIGVTDVGGLVGYENGGSISNSFATGGVTGFTDVGGLVGEFGGTLTNSYASGSLTGEIVPGSGSSGSPEFIGGLIGLMDSGSVAGSHATGNISADGGTYLGGLIGTVNPGNSATVDSSYATGSVDGGSTGFGVGGLIGDNGGQVTKSYALGAVTGEQNVGGLIGQNENDAPGTDADNPTGDGTVVDSFATGSVNGDANSIDLGGLVGYNNGAVKNAYSMGNVTGGNQLGGLVGTNVGSVHSAYSLGAVTAAAGASPTELGAVIGEDDSFDVASVYWDVDTSGIHDLSAGSGDFSNEPGLTGLTTVQLQSGLPSGFSVSDWKVIPGVSYPYLTWQYSGKPQVISGTVYGAGNVGLSGVIVKAMENGAALQSALASGNVVTYADGSYYILLAPRTISSSGSQVVTYTSGGATFVDNAMGSEVGLTIFGDELHAITHGLTYSGMEADLTTAVGGNTGLQTEIASLDNLAIAANGASFDIDAPVDVAGEVAVRSTGALDIGSSVTAGYVSLTSGGAIDASGGSIDAAILTGSSIGGADFSGTNQIAHLQSFTNSGTGGFSLDDGESLIVNGAVAAGNGNLTLDLSGAGPFNLTIQAPLTWSGAHTLDLDASGNIVLANTVTDTSGGTATLTAGGSIVETGSGAIQAGALGGSSGTLTQLNGANQIGTLNTFTAGTQFGLTDGASLDVIGNVSATAGQLALTTTGSGHGIQIDGSLSTAHTASLFSAGTLKEQGTGTITAASLTGTSAGDTTLNGNNQIAGLGDFGTLANFSLKDAMSLIVTGLVDTGAGTLTITAGAGDNIRIGGTLSTTGTMNLTSSGRVSEDASTGIIDAGLLNVSAKTGIVLEGNNDIQAVGTDVTVSGPNEIAGVQ